MNTYATWYACTLISCIYIRMKKEGMGENKNNGRALKIKENLGGKPKRKNLGGKT